MEISAFLTNLTAADEAVRRATANLCHWATMEAGPGGRRPLPNLATSWLEQAGKHGIIVSLATNGGDNQPSYSIAVGNRRNTTSTIAVRTLKTVERKVRVDSLRYERTGPDTKAARIIAQAETMEQSAKNTMTTAKHTMPEESKTSTSAKATPHPHAPRTRYPWGITPWKWKNAHLARLYLTEEANYSEAQTRIIFWAQLERWNTALTRKIEWGKGDAKCKICGAVEMVGHILTLTNTTKRHKNKCQHQHNRAVVALVRERHEGSVEIVGTAMEANGWTIIALGAKPVHKEHPLVKKLLGSDLAHKHPDIIATKKEWTAIVDPTYCRDNYAIMEDRNPQVLWNANKHWDADGFPLQGSAATEQTDNIDTDSKDAREPRPLIYSPGAEKMVRYGPIRNLASDPKQAKIYPLVMGARAVFPEHMTASLDTLLGREQGRVIAKRLAYHTLNYIPRIHKAWRNK
jgi:hypothetical protein